MKVGNGFEAGVVQGPLIEPAAIEKVERHVADAVAKGGTLTSGGHAPLGQFFEPTVVASATPTCCARARKPSAPSPPVPLPRPSQRRSTRPTTPSLGWRAYFYSRDIGRIHRVGEALEYGMVGVNVGILSTDTSRLAV